MARFFSRIWERGNEEENQGRSSVESREFPKGLVTDQKLVQWYFREFRGADVHPVATDRFLDKSKDQYNAAWLAREIVQNFVDHNPVAPGTLDGVSLKRKALKGGRIQFSIEGDWSFDDPTGVLSPHSEKSEDFETAGGNGIGLKQTAIRYLRDFGVSRFEVQGEGWKVNYRLAKAADINNDLEDELSDRMQSPTVIMKHDWLLGDMQETSDKGRVRYVIETDDEEAINALEQLSSLGVSKENEFLKDPDFENEHGLIKWILPGKSEGEIQGRLFVNGQVMNFKEAGKTSRDFWRGPEFVTLQINNVKYKMNIDRPPVSPQELRTYVHDLLSSMDKDELVDQLKRSEPIWTTQDEGDYFSRNGAFVLFEQIIRQLGYKGYDKQEYEYLFGDKPYLCRDRKLSSDQAVKLVEQGYVLCPSYFEGIGMPKASSKLDTLDRASSEMPQAFLSQKALEKLAKEHGIPVEGEFIEAENATRLGQILEERLNDSIESFEINQEDLTVRIHFKGSIPNELLFHSLSRPKEEREDQRNLHFIRGFIREGLAKLIFDKAFMSNGEYVTTFSSTEDNVTGETVLFARSMENSNGEFFVDIKLASDAFHQFVAVISPEKETGDRSIEGMPTSEIGEKSVDEIVATEPKKEGSSEDSIREQVDKVPVELPDEPDVAKESRVIKKEGKLSPQARERLEELSEKIPGIERFVGELERLVETKTLSSSESGDKNPVKKYLEWRGSDRFYEAVANEAGYLTGAHLLEILHESTEADIALAEDVRTLTPEERRLKQLNGRLKAIANRSRIEGESVDDFEIVLGPSTERLTQLSLLRQYLHLAIGAAIPNDLFIFRGTGTKAINIAKKAIGMHESIFSTSFREARAAFVHELAHNQYSGHDYDFMHMIQSLFAASEDRLNKIAKKAADGETLSDEERVIIDIRDQWEKLASAT